MERFVNSSGWHIICDTEEEFNEIPNWEIGHADTILVANKIRKDKFGKGLEYYAELKERPPQQEVTIYGDWEKDLEDNCFPPNSSEGQTWTEMYDELDYPDRIKLHHVFCELAKNPVNKYKIWTEIDKQDPNQINITIQPPIPAPYIEIDVVLTDTPTNVEEQRAERVKIDPRPPQTKDYNSFGGVDISGVFNPLTLQDLEEIRNEIDTWSTLKPAVCYLTNLETGEKVYPCECGSDKCGSPIHSSWCPRYKEPNG